MYGKEVQVCVVRTVRATRLAVELQGESGSSSGRDLEGAQELMQEEHRMVWHGEWAAGGL